MTEPKACTLEDLEIGLPGHITKIGPPSGTTDDLDLEELLLGLGFEEGATIELRHQGAFGGPLAVCVDGRMLAIRPRDARFVMVQPLSGSPLSEASA